jgi:hypothetical protein
VLDSKVVRIRKEKKADQRRSSNAGQMNRRDFEWWIEFILGSHSSGEHRCSMFSACAKRLDMGNLVPEVFARDWVTAWNRSDLEAIHYADDAVFVSPLAATLTGDPEVRGKAALAAYWTTALRSRSSPPQSLLESFV